MAIFGRRRASSHPRPSTTSASSAATLAASQAFLANKASNANLSSAAATAALRAHTPNPTPVGQIQTKRMQRRNSLSSQISAPEGRPTKPGELQRKNSSGSMTERTFRSPSPGVPQDRQIRPASSHGPYPRLDQNDAPPVPALPSNYVSPVQGSHPSARRPASVEPPQRMSSPLLKQAGGRGMSLNRDSGVETPVAMPGKKKKFLKSADEQEREGIRNPVNFSRPMSPENAPSNSPLAGGRVRSPPPTKVDPVIRKTEDAVEPAERAVKPTPNAAAAPVKKKKKRVVEKGLAETDDVSEDAGSSLHSRLASDATPQQLDASSTSVSSPVSALPAGGAKKSVKPKKKKKKPAEDGASQAGADSFGAAYPSDTDSVTSERSSTTDRPRSFSTRAAGLLAKQPSIVREDREGEKEAEETSYQRKSSTLATSNGIAIADKPTIASGLESTDRQHSRSASQQTPSKASRLDVTGVVRQASLSPGRTAHFSAQPVNEGQKHQPPGRSVSPAKSALKSSPSRGHSPIVTRRGLARSDASDSASQYSDDGSKSSIKKKSARVSFDEEPVVVGHAASPSLIPSPPDILSPQYRSAKTRTWIDLVREQNKETTESDRENDSVIKPTPALPSFGSIRDREPKSWDDADERTDLRKDRSMAPLHSLETSSDNAIGAIIATDANMSRNEDDERRPAALGPKDPIPPEVTSVEGSGYQSDSGDLSEEIEEVKEDVVVEEGKKKSVAAPPEAIDAPHSLDQQPETKLDASAAEQTESLVPSIAVQPATPGLEFSMDNANPNFDMPGGFPTQKENGEEPTSRAVSIQSETPATIGTRELASKSLAQQADSTPPLLGGVTDRKPTQIDNASADEPEGSDEGSIYGDAAEDQSDVEGDGFGSINAIVESPTTPTPALVVGSPPTSPLWDAKEANPRSGADQGKGNEIPELKSEDWDGAQAYWSSLSHKQKQQLEQAALPGAIDEPSIQNRTMRGTDALHTKKKKPKKTQAQLLANSNVPHPTPTRAVPPKASIRPTSPQVDSTPQFRSSMRSEPRKSALKNNDKRSSLISQPSPKGALQKKTRPVSAAAMVDYTKNASTISPISTRAISATTPAVSKISMNAQREKQSLIAKPKVQRANSDSDSSFKKARPKTPDGKRYTMRRSMRELPNETGPNRASSMVASTTSPAEPNVRRPFRATGPGATGGMRTSMRAPADTPKPVRTSNRNSAEPSKASRTKSPSRFSFLGTSKTKSVTAKSDPTSRFASRFADSSDEEDDHTIARSRFDNSSDENDEPAGLTPVRGIPPRINEGDSTDLDDSSEDKGPSLVNTQANANGNKKAEAPPIAPPGGSTLAAGPSRSLTGVQSPSLPVGTDLQGDKRTEREKKKRSFFGSLSGRKQDGLSQIQKLEVRSPAQGELSPERRKAEQITMKPEKSNLSGRSLGPSSPTADPVGMQKLENLSQTGSQTSLTQNSPKSPKLQRRITPKRFTSANNVAWPLPPDSAASTDIPARPKTSDGAATSNGNVRSGPSLVLRQSVQAPVGSSNLNGAADAGTKKKKFSMLRKAFGLQK